MIRKILGRTGLEVTQLGYGSMGIRGPIACALGMQVSRCDLAEVPQEGLLREETKENRRTPAGVV